MKGSFIFILWFTINYVSAQTVVINELVAKNQTIIQDEDEDYSDWIELYNPTNDTINLFNFGLSDDDDELDQWLFPQISILPGSYLLVFASDKNRHDTAELHTNFKISSDGESIFLSDSEGQLIDRTAAVELDEDQSYGRVPDGGANWMVISKPTPNTTNNHANELTFSHSEGFYSNEFMLKINASAAGEIRYTLDGSVPTEHGLLYTDTLIISDRSPEPNVVSNIPTTPAQNLMSYKAWEAPSHPLDKATILRCAAFSNGVSTSKIYTKTYFVGKDVVEKYSLPVISLITDQENLFNYNDGILVPGENYDSSNPEWTGNYFMKGREWERDVHIAYFDIDGDLGFAQDAGIRIHGGKTRQAAQKTLRLYARNEYGKQYFDYKLFPNREVNQYKRFILRTTMGAWRGPSVIKDALAHNIASSLNMDYQESQAVIVYVNGEYWGIHTMRDRIDERYLSYTHGIDEDSIEIKEWVNNDYDYLMRFIKNNSLEDSANYAYVLTQIDIDNYIDYNIAEFFFSNIDWPGNNIKLWRKLPSGKWRWILFDLDAGFWEIEYNMLLHATKNDPNGTGSDNPRVTFLFRNLLKSESFRTQFINRYAEVLNSDFMVDVTLDKLDAMKAIYAAEMPEHIRRWNFPSSYDRWEEVVEDELRTYLKLRPCAVKQHIMDFFELDEFDFDCKLSIDDPNAAEDVLLLPNPSSGDFVLYNKGKDLTHASIVVVHTNGQLVYEEFNVELLNGELKNFNLNHLVNGTYILRLFSDNYSSQRKIVLLR